MQAYLLVVLPVLFSGASTLLLFWLRSRQEQIDVEKKRQQNQPVESATAAEIQGKAYQAVIDQLQEDIELINKDRKQLRVDLDAANKRLDDANDKIEKLAEENKNLADEFIKSREGWKREREALYARIGNLLDDLKMSGKLTTDELNDKKGYLGV